jgi:hypothetical protein
MNVQHSVPTSLPSLTVPPATGFTRPLLRSAPVAAPTTVATFAPPRLAPPTLAPPSAAATTPAASNPAASTTTSVTRIGDQLKAAPGALKMVYGGLAVMVLASRMPVAGLKHLGGDTTPIPFSSSGSVLLVAIAATMVWLSLPVLSGRLAARRFTWLWVVTGIAGLLNAVMYAAVPKIAERADPLPQLTERLDLPKPSAAPGLGLYLLTLAVALMSIGLVRLWGWNRRQVGS